MEQIVEQPPDGTLEHLARDTSAWKQLSADNREILLRLIEKATTHGEKDPTLAQGAEPKSYEPRYQPSTMIGPYKLLHPIGVGGMGEVWMAEQERPVHRRVALKVIRAGQDAKQIVARFEVERQALAMMEHPNIAKVLDAGATADGLPYFVMELVQGTPITEYCDQHRLSIGERLKLFVPVCRAAQHAHQKGIIHRDLKPSNILVTQYDGHPVPKVIDFGLAKALQHQSKLTDKTFFTEFGRLVGTLQYMSPEQAEANALDIDTRSDVYALGVLLYELLTGSTPIEREMLKRQALYKVLETIREHDPPRPSARLSSSSDRISGISQQRQIDPRKLTQLLRGDLDWIVMKALEKDRGRRYATANDLSEEVERFLAGRPVAAKPPSIRYQLRKFVARNRLLTSAATAIALLRVTSATAGSYLAVVATRAQRLAESKQQQLAAHLDLLESVFTELDPHQEKLGDAQLRQRLGENLRQAVEQLEKIPSSDVEQSLDLFDALNKALGGLGFPQHALRAAEAARRLIPNDSMPSKLSLRADLSLAGAQYHLNRFAEAISLLERIAPQSNAIHGSDAAETIDTRLSLAYAYSQNGQNDKAIVIYDELLPRLQSDSDLVKQYLAALNEGGLAYGAAGNQPLALECQQRAVQLCEEHYGKDQSNTITAKVNLGNTLNDQRRFQDARSLMEQAYASALRTFGDKHSQTAVTLNMLLATCGRNNGDPEFSARMKELLPLSQASYEYLVSNYGPDHPDTLAVFGNLASAYGLAGDLEKCIRLHRQKVVSVEKLYGLEDPRTYGARDNLAVALRENGNYSEAAQIWTAVVAFYKKEYGPLDRRTIAATQGLAFVTAQRALGLFFFPNQSSKVPKK